LYPLTSGAVSIGERNIGALAPHAAAGAGVSRTFQNIRLFTGLTAGENVAVAALARGASLSEALATAEHELSFVGLEGAGQKRADSLAYGARRRLEIARALAAEPRFLLLDEPAAGMNPEETEDLAQSA
jgi:ABC-type branched-subunit amino acid transport system ATPase component